MTKYEICGLYKWNYARQNQFVMNETVRKRRPHTVLTQIELLLPEGSRCQTEIYKKMCRKETTKQFFVDGLLFHPRDIR
jgi:hypothetical protein